MFAINSKFFLLTALVAVSSCGDAQAQTNDDFYTQQWGLQATGQIYRRDIDDITSEEVVTKPRFDIGISQVANQLPAMMKKQVVVAVLDTGLDLEHPDIKDNIAKNSIECTAAGLLEPKPTQDRDGNGFIGDCMGWNFLEKNGGNHRPYDDDGHGTHVAGIIAAATNNGQGIAGIASFSGNVKMLPVKIISVSGDENRNLAKTEIFAKGIRYAADRGVDVINMSLGWPVSMQTGALREALNYAIGKGITVVAAAGNNAHPNPTFPCAVKGVICVGATSPNGQMAEFSNYGGAVDFLAPGEFIYSLFPSKLNPQISGVKGIEVKNGSSQAAPFVSAIVAILRGSNPDISADEIYARLALSAQNVELTNPANTTLHGQVNLFEALNAVPQAVVEPMFKDNSYISYSSEDGSFSYNLPIASYWKESSNVLVTLSTPDDTISFSQSEFSIPEISAGGIYDLDLSGQVENSQAHSEVPIAVTVEANGSSRTFRTVLFFSKNIKSDSRVTRVGLPAELRNSSLRSVADPQNLSPLPEFFVTNDAGGKTKVSLIRLGSGVSGGSASIINSFILATTGVLSSILRVDANLDGQGDYLLYYSEGDSKKVAWLNQDFLPLYGKSSVWTVKADASIPPPEGNVAFTKVDVNGLGVILTPVVFAAGLVPKLDAYEDPFGDNSANNKVGLHLYFFNPVRDNSGELSAQLRIIDNNILRQQAANKIAPGQPLAIQVAALVPQTKAISGSGLVQALFHFRQRNNQVQQFVLSIQGGAITNFDKIDFSNSENIISNKAQRLRNLDGARAEFNYGLSYTAFFNRNRVRSVAFSPKGVAGSIRPIASSEFDYSSGKRDLVIDSLGGFYSAGSTYFIYQSKQKLLTQRVVNGQVMGEFALPIFRYSFLPSEVFNQMFYPVAYGNSGSRFPALYTDNSAISRGSVQLTVITPAGASRPMNMSLTVEEGCRSLNPARVGDNADFSFVFACPDSLKFLSMSYR